MTSRIGCYADGGDCVSRMVVNSFDLRKGREVVSFCI